MKGLTSKLNGFPGGLFRDMRQKTTMVLLCSFPILKADFDPALKGAGDNMFVRLNNMSYCMSDVNLSQRTGLTDPGTEEFLDIGDSG
jgi:hypothetical protein